MPTPVGLDSPALFDTGVWTWARDHRLPHLAEWFNAQVESRMALVCDLVVLELTRLSPNEDRAREVSERLDAVDSTPMPSKLWSRARETQFLLAPIRGVHPLPAGRETGYPLSAKRRRVTSASAPGI